MSVEREAALRAIAEEVSGCTRCALHTGRTQTVPGYGSATAEIMFIGEAPGYYEDQQGLPFVGRSGKYLDYLLNKINLERKDVFIANVVKCRPPNNRDPLPDEIIACNSYLKRQIEIIDPLVIATLGRFSMNLFFPNARISRIHGQPKYEDGRAYYPFFHPAAALRNPNLRHDMEADMARLLDVLAEVRRRREQGTGPEAAEAPSEAREAPESKDEPEDDGPPKQLRLF